MSSANIELLFLLETRSTEAFPMVAQYLNKEIGPFLISQSEIKNSIWTWGGKGGTVVPPI